MPQKLGLFSPIKINNLVLPNRIMMSPAFSNSATPDGHATGDTIRHYAARARSGIGLIMTEHTSVNSYYLHPGNRLQISRDEHVAGLARLVSAVHDEGCKIGLQIAHSIHAVGLKPEDLSNATCYEIIEDFVAGARRAYQAGFDLIELHYAHTYTMADFLSRRTNRRTDEFGGDIYGRMRIHLEIIRRVREIVGRGFPLFARISADEFVVGGNTLKQTRIVARELEKATIDCLDVSVGVRFDDGGLKGYSDIRGKPTIEFEDGPNVFFAEELKKEISIPVITVGKLGNPVFAASVIEEGRADIVALARPLIADPMWVDKVRRGRYDLIHECIYCNSCLYDRIHKEDPVRCLTYPCQNECPAGVDIPGYIDLVAQERFAEAYAVIQEENPFPLMCGRVCHHPCETACNRRRIDEPLAIKDLKRYLTDRVVAQGDGLPKPAAAAANGLKVAVVGAGPSGLTCAFYLAKTGYEVTVFEALPVAGGMPAVAIPEYRLPIALLNKEIELIKSMGVNIVLNTTVGKDVTLADLKAQGFKAVYIAVGAHAGGSLGVAGEDLEGVEAAIPLLKRIKENKDDARYKGKKVVVIGGGNVAVDVARSLVRTGAEVQVYCLEAADAMPAFPWEVAEAVEEGVTIHNGWGPAEFVADVPGGGRVARAVFKRCVSVFDDMGCFNPRYDKQQTCTEQADAVIVAAGQRPETTFNAGDETVLLARGNRVKVSRDGMTNSPAVFAGGDCVTGPDSVVGAVRAAKTAAAAIDRFLGGRGEIIAPKVRNKQLSRPIDEQEKQREINPKVPAAERARCFVEIETGFSSAAAAREACRCLRCDVNKHKEL
jgi:NADPH-dependent glutamate synthase beta subunit-like oxidoreductase/2,4-dienoyl-CoA reductase-like NADH-dependent reductase (Old Yellow Enzyme family)